MLDEVVVARNMPSAPPQVSVVLAVYGNVVFTIEAGIEGIVVEVVEVGPVKEPLVSLSHKVTIPKVVVVLGGTVVVVVVVVVGTVVVVVTVGVVG